MDPRQEWQRQHARNNPTQERNAHHKHQHHSSLPNNSHSTASGPMGAHLQDQQPRARIISLPAYKRHSSTITAGALNRTLDRPSYTPANQSLQSHGRYSDERGRFLRQRSDKKEESGHGHGTRPAINASSGPNTPDSSNSDERLRKGSGRSPADTASRYTRLAPISQFRRIPSPTRTYSTTPQHDPSHVSESEESEHTKPTALRTAVRAHNFDRVRHPQGHVTPRRSRRSPIRNHSFSSTHDWSDEDSRGKVRMARRESITSSFATTRTLPPPNISKMTRLNVSRLDQTDFKQRIQELKSSLANRQHHVDGAQRVTAEQIEVAHRTYGSEDPSVTVTESVVSNSIPQDSTLERSHEIGRDEEEDNTDSHDASATMENNEDDARDDLRNIRDEIHDMLATLERSKVSTFESNMRVHA